MFPENTCWKLKPQLNYLFVLSSLFRTAWNRAVTILRINQSQKHEMQELLGNSLCFGEEALWKCDVGARSDLKLELKNWSQTMRLLKLAVPFTLRKKHIPFVCRHLMHLTSDLKFWKEHCQFKYKISVNAREGSLFFSGFFCKFCCASLKPDFSEERTIWHVLYIFRE